MRSNPLFGGRLEPLRLFRDLLHTGRKLGELLG